MKRTFFLLLLLLTSIPAAWAQQMGAAGGADKQVVLFIANVLGILLTIGTASFFLLSLIRLLLNYRLRNALLKQNATEEIIIQLLPPKDNTRFMALKWGCLFAAGGAGLAICYFFQPVGLHWTIILSLSLSAGLFIFYFISKRLN